MKQALSVRRQLAINLRYCYSARRATQNMSASRMRLANLSLPNIDIYLRNPALCSLYLLIDKFCRALFKCVLILLHLSATCRMLDLFWTWPQVACWYFL